MSAQTKRILSIISFLVLCGLIGFALWWVFFRVPAIVAPPVVVPPVVVKPPGGGTLPGGGGERPVTPVTPTEAAVDTIAKGDVTKTTQLTTSAVLHPTLSGDGKSLNAYNPADGIFYRLQPDGSITQLSPQRFRGAQNVSWNKGGSKAVIEYPDGSNIIYDFQSQSQETLPAHWEDFAFSPVRDEVVAKSIGIDPNNRWLVIRSADGTSVSPIAALGENANKVITAWSPNDQVIGFADTADQIGGGFGRELIIPIGKNNENFKGLTVEGLLFEPLWAPSGKQLLYSSVGDISENRPTLWLVDGSPSSLGEHRRTLGVNTWADKCSFGAGDTLYCAVPKALPANVGLQRALADTIPDNLYRINITTGHTELLAIPDTNTTIGNIIVSQDESTLYFQNAQTGLLETIRLK
ncbi:hypothetical protein HYV73_02955 [Candidatus Uhrbacteria bacterium]|nr:hypothetical protein [Candidatus Uhrbacteria bacterium]